MTKPAPEPFTATIHQEDLESYCEPVIPRGYAINWDALVDASDAYDAANEAFCSAVQSVLFDGLSEFKEDRDACPEWLVRKAKKTDAA